jgi:hypothetical protein
MDDVGFGSCASQIIYDRILKSLAVGADDEARPRARQQLFVNLFLLKKKRKKKSDTPYCLLFNNFHMYALR